MTNEGRGSLIIQTSNSALVEYTGPCLAHYLCPATGHCLHLEEKIQNLSITSFLNHSHCHYLFSSNISLTAFAFYRYSKWLIILN